MSNQKIYIPSGGIGEIEYDDQENNWFQTSSAEFYEENHTIVLLIVKSYQFNF